MNPVNREFADQSEADVDPNATLVTRQTPEGRALDITETVEYEAQGELGESVEVVVEGARIEAFLSDAAFVLDPSLPDARFALRAYAYRRAASGHVAEAQRLLRQFGREG